MTTLPNCDCCGRFTVPGAPGSSWVMVPSIDVPGWDYRVVAFRRSGGMVRSVVGLTQWLS